MGAPVKRGLALVTGGAGGIGNHLVERLLKADWHVRVVDNFSSGTKENLARFASHDGFEAREIDMLDLKKLTHALERVDFVWHLSANPDIRKGTIQTDLDLQQGPVATRNLLESMRTHSVKGIAFSSSSVVYGFPKTFPTPEEYGPLLPESLYGASKLACEGLISSFCHTFGMKAWIFRFANVIGPGATHGVIYDFLMKLKRNPTRLEILGNGKQSKGYLWVTDCVEAMVHCTETASETVNVFNLAPGDHISVAQIGGLVLELRGSHARIEYTGGEKGWAGDVPQQRLAIDRLLNTGFKPRYNSEQAVRMAIEVLGKELA